MIPSIYVLSRNMKISVFGGEIFNIFELACFRKYPHSFVRVFARHCVASQAFRTSSGGKQRL